jgi:hypothetical protein
VRISISKVTIPSSSPPPPPLLHHHPHHHHTTIIVINIKWTKSKGFVTWFEEIVTRQYTRIKPT